MTCQDVAKHLGKSWDTVRDIEKQSFERDFSKPRLKDVTHIAIDEIAVKKGHNYLTVVMDLHSCRVIFVGDGKGADALLPFWKRLRQSRANIIAVCSDMSSAYTKAIQNHLPEAIHVYDRFHVMKLFNEKLSDMRRRLYRETKDAEEKEALIDINMGTATYPTSAVTNGAGLAVPSSWKNGGHAMAWVFAATIDGRR